MAPRSADSVASASVALPTAASAAALATERIVPSTGCVTARQLRSLARASAAATSGPSAVAAPLSAMASAKPRTTWLRITPEFPAR